VVVFDESMEGMKGFRVGWLVGLVLGILSFGSCRGTGWGDIVVIPNLFYFSVRLYLMLLNVVL
jgi:hypothetical protein